MTLDAYVAAGAAALVCLVALVAAGDAFVTAVRDRPRRRGARRDREHRAATRHRHRPAGGRGLGLWQLRHYGAPLTRSVQGTLGLDPLLVATPAIGLLAGGVAALRLVPLLAQLAERATTRRRGLVPALGARQLARRPLRYTRAALLLMLAMAMGVFAVCYTATWSASQRDQASFQVGADVRVQPGRQLESMPRLGARSRPTARCPA